MKNSGFHSVTAESIPEGAIVTKRTWHVPGHYGTGPEFSTKIAALEHAIGEKQEAVDAHNIHEANLKMATRSPLPERITIDLRWTMAWDVDPIKGGASGMDFTITRMTFTDLEEAREALARIKQFTPEA